jgi:hypothetical protein
MRYLLGSSFFDGGKNGPEFRRAFAPIWSANVAKLTPQPSRIVIICEAGSKRPTVGWNTDVIRLTGDCGNCDQILKGKRPNDYSGWTAGMAALAMLAYVDMADFVYFEEDCLAFGDVIGQAYRDMGDGDMVFGRKMMSAPWMPCSQAFFLVRHRAIPQFVSDYLALGGERSVTNLGEHKHCKIEQKWGSQRARRLTLGCDRERPIPWDAPAFFCQQWTLAELAEAKRRNMI